MGTGTPDGSYVWEPTGKNPASADEVRLVACPTTTASESAACGSPDFFTHLRVRGAVSLVGAWNNRADGVTVSRERRQF